jgi:hypothetical protein
LYEYERIFKYHFIFVVSFSFAQKDSLLYQREKELENKLSVLRKASNDLERDKANEDFKGYLLETIQLENAFSHPFKSLKTLGSIASPDNTFRMFNWNVEQEDQSQKYYCYILKKDDRKNKYYIIELQDKSFMLPPRPEDVLSEDQWYGALYYKIIPFEKSGKKYYTLLGWDGNNGFSSVKLIDVLYFSGKHAKLGNAVFKTKDGVQKRVFFEYSKKAFMSLNYDEERGRIVFDHLSPESPGMEGFYEYYVPDMSYDAFVYKDNKWHMIEDVVVLNNSAPKKIEIKTLNTETGDVVSKEVKNSWIDPTNENAPAGGNIHSKALPEEELISNQEKKTKKTNEVPVKSAKKSKKKKEEFSIIPSVATGKKRKK